MIPIAEDFTAIAARLRELEEERKEAPHPVPPAPKPLTVEGIVDAWMRQSVTG